MTVQRVCVAAASAVLTACVASSGAMPGSGRWMVPSENGAFVTTLGNDTLALEQFEIRGNTLDAEAVTRSPRTAVRTVHMEWTDDGLLRAYEITERAAGAPRDSVRSSTSVVLRGDSLVWTTRSPSGTRTVSRPARDTRGVFSPPLYAQYAVLARMAFAGNMPTIFITTGADGFTTAVSRPQSDVIALTDPQLGTVRLLLDRQVRLRGIDATPSTLGHRVTRVSAVNVAEWANTFAARDRAGAAIGVLSLPDSVRARVGSANVAINYHRPAKRGRVIFGNVVRWGQVWRTGANQATAFTTDRDLMIGATRVPAGSYTLWTIPNQTGWQLILNKQTGQWGTVYNAAQDLAHIPMRVEPTREPVELFTIQFEPRNDGTPGQQLVLMWDRTRAIVPVEVRAAQ